MTGTARNGRGRGASSFDVVWRSIDLPPNNLARCTFVADFRKKLDAEVRRLDPSNRPHADDTDIVAWGQSPDIKDTGEFKQLRPVGKRGEIQQAVLNKRFTADFRISQRCEFFSASIIRNHLISERVRVCPATASADGAW